MQKNNIVKIGVREIVAKYGSYLGEYTDAQLLCGGNGKCGKCKVRASGALSPVTEDEKRLLTSKEIEQGIRLACRARIEGDCTVEYLDDAFGGERIALDGIGISSAENRAFEKYGVALDIGTTTLAARLYDKSGRVIGQSAMLNPQLKWGADVISRIEAVLAGKGDELKEAVLHAIDRMIIIMSDEGGIDKNDIDCVVITGNTTMLCLLTGSSVNGIAKAPFRLERRFNESLTAGDMGITALKNDAEVFLPACISSFVGADITCAIIATDILRDGKTRLLVDIGTNGEMCLWHNNRLLVSSTAAGPAFEGVGISCGMRAQDGAIDKAECRDNVFTVHVIGGGKAVGLCGSGLVDAVATLLDMGVLDETGAMDDDFTLAEDVVLTQEDIRTVQMTKSAISAGVKTLFETAEINEIDESYLAGGFGSYIDVGNAVKIGLLPENAVKELTVAGNAALSGATMILMDRSLKEECMRIATEAEHVSFAANPVFAEHYMRDFFDFGRVSSHTPWVSYRLHA